MFTVLFIHHSYSQDNNLKVEIIQSTGIDPYEPEWPINTVQVWIKKYGNRKYQKAISEIIVGEYDDIEEKKILSPGLSQEERNDEWEAKRRVVMQMFVQISPENNIDVRKSLEKVINNINESPLTRFYALQTLLRRHPLEAREYAMKKMSEWSKLRNKEDAGKQEKQLGQWAYQNDWFDGHYFRVEGQAQFIQPEKARKTINRFLKGELCPYNVVKVERKV